MSDLPESPPRPDPHDQWRNSLSGWVAWFGLGRIVATCLSLALVVAGGYYLVRAPRPPTEANMPLSSAAGAGVTASIATLPRPSPASTSSLPTVVVVHVAGAVASPGVYELEPNARVRDAILAAGDESSLADLDGLNLAAPLVDGQRIYVPSYGEVDPAAVPDLVVGPGTAEGEPTIVDLNSASSDELLSLPGIGPATAAAIVDDRDRRGPFMSVGDLERVPGIGPSKLAAISDLVTV